MRKTGDEIEMDLFGIISESPIKNAISGNVYLDGTRPADSQEEDAIVAFVSGEDGVIQEGVVNLDIYVPDIDNGAGTKIKDTSRCQELSAIARDQILLMSSPGYLFSLNGMIKSYKTENTKQYFVNVPIKFKLMSI